MARMGRSSGAAARTREYDVRRPPVFEPRRLTCSSLRLQRVLPVAVLSLAAVLLTNMPVQTHYPVTTSVRFNREIAAVLNARCVSCHREKSLAMPLLTYAQARPWAEAIKEEVLGRRMPPWTAERGYGTFANDGGLTPREREFLLSWIDGGAPEGDGTPPPFQDHTGHWMLGSPDDLYVAVLERESPASTPGFATVDVTRFIVRTRERQPVSVRALDVAMPDRRAVRSAFLSVLETGQYLGGWTPWHSAIELPPGAAFRLPPGARIAIDVVHAGAEGVEEPPQLAVYRAPDDTTPVAPLVLAGEGAGGGVVRMSEHVPTSLTLVAFRVGLSEGARSIELTVRRPDGTTEPLLWIRQVRPEWQTPYVLREPLALPNGSTLQATARFEAAAPLPIRASVELVVHERGALPSSRPVAAPHVH